jgi:hypothetical protein
LDDGVASNIDPKWDGRLLLDDEVLSNGDGMSDGGLTFNDEVAMSGVVSTTLFPFKAPKKPLS